MVYCGIDGGQTSTKCVLGTADGQLIGKGRGGPLIHLSAAGGPQQFVASITEAIASALPSVLPNAKTGSAYQPAKALSTASNGVPHSLTSVVVGATGVFEDTIEVSTAIEHLAPELNPSHLNVCSDALIALVGAHAGAPGIMVISGTGTIAYGMDHQGTIVRAGGWGWPLGDEGSAYAIGRAGIRAALFGHDLLEPATILTDLMVDHFQVKEAHDIKRLYFSPNFSAPGFAALAPMVSQASQRGDDVAKAIIATSGEALAKQAAAVAQKLAMPEQTIHVSPVGGAFEHVTGLKDAFATALDRAAMDRAAMDRAALNLATRSHNGPPSTQKLRMTAPQLPPQSGAFLMALQQDGHHITNQLLSAIQAWEL